MACLSAGGPFAWNSSAPSVGISVTFYIGAFFKILLRKFKFCSNLTRVAGTLHEDLCTFMKTYRWILLKMGCFIQISTEDQNTHCTFKVCKSVYHRTVQINHQPHATVFQFLLYWRLFTAQHVSGVSPPIIRSSMTAVAASGFTFVSWWQSCCVRVRAGHNRPDHEHSTTVTTIRR